MAEYVSAVDTELDALRAECDRLGKVEGQLLAEIERLKEELGYVEIQRDDAREGIKHRDAEIERLHSLIVG